MLVGPAALSSAASFNPSLREGPCHVHGQSLNVFLNTCGLYLPHIFLAEEACAAIWPSLAAHCNDSTSRARLLHGLRFIDDVSLMRCDLLESSPPRARWCVGLRAGGGCMALYKGVVVAVRCFKA